MATKPRPLKYGETPWDDLPRESLLREVQRMYSAVAAAKSVLRLIRRDERTGFWGYGGSGGVALEMCRQIVDETETAFSGEDMHYAFFRYARDLLFTQNEYEIGSRWHVCTTDGCKTMTGTVGTPIVPRCPHCNSEMRRIVWDDLSTRWQKD